MASVSYKDCVNSKAYSICILSNCHYLCRSKTIPTTHRPNWNDIRIVRAILSLLEAALSDEKTTHILLCTESCIPIATLLETGRSVLLDEVCNWEERKNDDDKKQSGDEPEQKHISSKRLNWDRSYIDCYDRKSSRCTRFDEREFIFEMIAFCTKCLLIQLISDIY